MLCETETAHLPAGSHLETDDLKSLLRLFVVHDGKVEVVVDRVT